MAAMDDVAIKQLGTTLWLVANHDLTVMTLPGKEQRPTQPRALWNVQYLSSERCVLESAANPGHFARVVQSPNSRSYIRVEQSVPTQAFPWRFHESHDGTMTFETTDIPGLFLDANGKGVAFVSKLGHENFARWVLVGASQQQHLQPQSPQPQPLPPNPIFLDEPEVPRQEQPRTSLPQPQVSFASTANGASAAADSQVGQPSPKRARTDEPAPAQPHREVPVPDREPVPEPPRELPDPDQPKPEPPRDPASAEMRQASQMPVPEQPVPVDPAEPVLPDVSDPGAALPEPHLPEPSVPAEPVLPVSGVQKPPSGSKWRCGLCCLSPVAVVVVVLVMLYTGIETWMSGYGLRLHVAVRLEKYCMTKTQPSTSCEGCVDVPRRADNWMCNALHKGFSGK